MPLPDVRTTAAARTRVLDFENVPIFNFLRGWFAVATVSEVWVSIVIDRSTSASIFLGIAPHQNIVPLTLNQWFCTPWKRQAIANDVTQTLFIDEVLPTSGCEENFNVTSIGFGKPRFIYGGAGYTAGGDRRLAYGGIEFYANFAGLGPGAGAFGRTIALDGVPLHNEDGDSDEEGNEGAGA